MSFIISSSLTYVCVFLDITQAFILFKLIFFKFVDMLFCAFFKLVEYSNEVEDYSFKLSVLGFM